MFELTIKDFGLIREAVLPLGIPGITMIWGDNQDNDTTDSNESGKSTVGRALTWGLFGTIPESGSVIHYGEKQSVVTVQCGDMFIERTAKQGKRSINTSLKLYQMLDDLGKSENISGATQTDTQKVIEDIVGINYDVWHNTVMYAQMDDKRFLRATDAERKALLRNIFNFEILSDALKKARKELKSVNVSIATQDIDLARFRNEIQSKEHIVTDATTNIRQLKADRAKAAGMKVEELDRLETEFKQEREECQGKLDSIKFDDLEGKQAELEEKGNALDDTQRKNVISRTSIKSDVERWADDLEMLEEKGECPTCGTSTDQLEDVIVAKRKLRDEHLEQLKKAQDEANEINQDKRDLAEEVRKSNEAFHERNMACEAIKEELNILRINLESLDMKRQAVESIDKQIKRYKATKVRIKNEIANINDRITDAEAEKTQLADQKEMYEFWSHGFGIEGLQNDIFDQLIDQLTHWANEYLNILTDGTIKLSFDTKTELAKGTIKDKFAVHWDAMGYHDAILSQSQQKKISIAIDLALAEMIRGRNKFNMLILDELFDSLDVTSKGRVLTLLEELKSRYRSIYVITHDSALSGEFDQSWRVRRKGGKSEVFV